MATEHLQLIRQMKHRRPFTPFRIKTTTGQEYRIEGRFQFAVPRNHVAFYVCPELRTLVQLAADQVSEVEELKEKPAA